MKIVGVIAGIFLLLLALRACSNNSGKDRLALEAELAALVEERKMQVKELALLQANRIEHHEAWVGMTRDQLEQSWGQPEWGRRSVTASGTHDQWHYKKKPYSYVYLDNGIVTTLRQ